MEQLDLFSEIEIEEAPPLNGFYYEARTRRFVSYCNGRRHFEIPASRCKARAWPKDWQEKIMRERAI
ncbi:hypothetical protein D3P09_02460 [Paenibacillus pinisoli]|uniref:Uncharacterized protein n=1 Tax=Paenibacillus pinisoli TaxID=1276110 RepID=A0A3A6PK64_9BACL|nr:hypothetical protein D3P09_02460 [Paenibacillus pinisoli]